jgi:hypothetical protein
MDKENVVYIYTVKYYSTLKKSGIILLAGKWMELEFIILNKRR